MMMERHRWLRAMGATALAILLVACSSAAGDEGGEARPTRSPEELVRPPFGPEGCEPVEVPDGQDPPVAVPALDEWIPADEVDTPAPAYTHVSEEQVELLHPPGARLRRDVIGTDSFYQSDTVVTSLYVNGVADAEGIVDGYRSQLLDDLGWVIPDDAYHREGTEHATEFGCRIVYTFDVDDPRHWVTLWINEFSFEELPRFTLEMIVTEEHEVYDGTFRAGTSVLLRLRERTCPHYQADWCQTRPGRAAQS